MPDYGKIVSNLDRADVSIRKCEEAMTPISKVKQVDAYMLGLLQSIHLLIAETKRAALAAERSEKQNPPRKTILKQK